MVDGLPDRLRLALLAGVDAAHDALQLGELPHHVGGQVRLRQRARAARVRRGVGAFEHVAGDPLGQVGHALRFGAVAPEPFVEQQRVEPVEPVVKPVRAVGVPEEAGVAQPRHEHALGVAGDAGDVVARRVGDRQEVRQESAAGIDHREVVLVVHHRGRQHFVRELEELPRKAPGHHRRVLYQVGHLAGQRRLCLDRRYRAAGLRAQAASLRVTRARRSARSIST